MSNTIVLKRSSVGGKVPLSANLAYGELALNYRDGVLYYLNTNNTVTTISSTVSGGVANAFPVINSNGVLVSSTLLSQSVANSNVTVSGNLITNAVYTNNYFFANGQSIFSGATYGNTQVEAYLQISSTISGINANIVAANATVATLQANVGSFYTWANTNFGTNSYSNTNVAAYLASSTIIAAINANVTAANATISVLQANVGAYELWANANVGGLQTQINNLGTTANANTLAYLSGYTGTVTLGGNLTVTGNLSILGNITNLNYETVTYTETANVLNVAGVLTVGAGNLILGGVDVTSNLGALASSINTLQANVGAYEIYANIGTILTSLNTLTADVGAYELYANANLGTVYTNLNTLTANVGSFYTWANANFGTSSYSNTNVAAYINTISINTVGNITANNITANNITANSNVIVGTGAGGSITGANLVSSNYFQGNVFNYANGVSILSSGLAYQAWANATFSTTTYSNANAVAMLAANSVVYIGNVGNVSSYPILSNITQVFIGGNTAITSGNAAAQNSTLLMYNLYLAANGAIMTRNTTTGVGYIIMDSTGIAFNGYTGAVTANTVPTFNQFLKMNGSIGAQFSGAVTAGGAVTGVGLTSTGGLALNTSGTITTNQASASIFSATATSIAIGGAANGTIILGPNTPGSLGNVFVANAIGTTNGNLTIRARGTYNTFAGIVNSSGGYNSPPYNNQATTGGSGTGMIVNLTGVTGGYPSGVTVVNPGSGYKNGDLISVTGGASFTLANYNPNYIGIGQSDYIFTIDGNLLLPNGGNINYANNVSVFTGIYNTLANLQANLNSYETYANTAIAATYSNANVTAYLAANPISSILNGTGSSVGFNVSSGNVVLQVGGTGIATFAQNQVNVTGNAFVSGNVNSANLNATSAYITNYLYPNGVSILTAVNNNMTAANLAIATLQSEVYSNANAAAYLAAGTDPTILAIDANVVAANSAIVTANSAMQSYVTSYVNTQINLLINSAPSTLDTLGQIAANLATDANSINAILSSITSTNSNVSVLDANVGAFELYTNANIGTLYLGNISTQSNLGAFQTYANANIGAIYTNLGALTTNVGAYETWANGAISGLNANITAANVAIATLQSEVYSNANVIAFLAINSGNISTGNIIATGEIITSGGIFWPNGHPYASGGGGTGITYTASNTTPSFPNIGDQWYYEAGDTLLEYMTDGTSTMWVDITGAATSYLSNTANISTNFIPVTNYSLNLGSNTNAFGNLYVANISLNGATIEVDSASGAMALIPPVTAYAPNPTGLVISPRGIIGTISTVGGVPAAGAIATAANVGSAFNVATTSSTAPATPNPGDTWYDTANDVLYRYTYDGTNTYWVDVESPTIGAATYSSNLIVANLLPAVTNTVTLGNVNNQFANVYSANISTGNVYAVNNYYSGTTRIESKVPHPFMLMGA